MKRKLLALAFVAVGVAALGYAARGEGRSPIGIATALVAFFVAANLISRVAAMASRLRPFIGRTVTARAWKNPLAGADAFEVTSVRAIGAGLHIYLRPAGGSAVHLKIAQPRGVEITESGVEVADAKYVQWGGHKLVRQPSAPALVIEAEK